MHHTAHERIAALFNEIYPISAGLSESIRQHSKVITVEKRAQLLHIDETCKSIYFILRGGVRTYYIDKEGNDITSWLLFEGELAISVYSFFSQRPSFEAIETLERCTLLALTYEKLSLLYRQYPEFNFIGRHLTEHYYIRSEAKANTLRMLSAKERYLDLLKSQPQLLTRVPLGYVASYLGINQSTLSRIRASI
ncbi:cAMP-binding domain of CRP or a regulatory subunit of cAMP-dependent protein kinases [Parapedobacter koreensis]|uniref:cAMP-binding domain of CRP or a regulatory subunit of cAMP-dependent protein kinases n=2 Tax=Parapedobacter koreensis TaxID=332977 RepID=A0A1H7J3U9_9SPHI|nr:cAMP-binding domain of CRP or a regulatory subunit of cAMP-dependent protein kinases [Parapedobacter koreensis]